VTGFTDFDDFPTTPGVVAAKRACGTFSDQVFVTKVNAEGSALVYSTFIGGCGRNGSALTVDSTGDAYVVGFTGSPDLPVTADALQRID
jgi:hypothetical protein